MRIGLATAVTTALFLAACGGGSGNGPEDAAGGHGGVMASGPGEPPGTGGGDVPVVALPGPVDAVLGQLPAGFSVSYDRATDTVTIDDGTGPVLLGNAVPSPRLFQRYNTRGPSAIWFEYAETASGSGAASFFVNSRAGVAGTMFSRLSETRLPDSGTAEFSGQYTAVLVGSDARPASRIAADATLMADFAAGSVSGEITNRRAELGPSTRLILGPAGISDGAFTGTATGGELISGSTISSGTTTMTGSYAGLFTGANGAEVVGGVAIPHIAEGAAVQLWGDQPLTEIGAFLAERTGP